MYGMSNRKTNEKNKAQSKLPFCELSEKREEEWDNKSKPVKGSEK